MFQRFQASVTNSRARFACDICMCMHGYLTMRPLQSIARSSSVFFFVSSHSQAAMRTTLLICITALIACSVDAESSGHALPLSMALSTTSCSLNFTYDVPMADGVTVHGPFIQFVHFAFRVPVFDHLLLSSPRSSRLAPAPPARQSSSELLTTR